jgi:cell division septation protein DedD
MSDNDPKASKDSAAQDKKGKLIRADVVGRLDRDEENVVDWIDDAPVPTETETIVSPDAPVLGDDAAASPEPRMEAETPSETPAEGDEKKTGRLAQQQPAGEKPADTVTAPKPKTVSPAGRLSSQPDSKTTPPPQKPATAAPRKQPPRPAARPTGQAKTAPSPAKTKRQRPLLSRILLWGTVLIIITVTVRYFVSAGSEETVVAPAETGQLFHKIAPLPTPASGPVPGQPTKVKATASPAKAPAPPETAPPPAKPAPPDKTVKAYAARSYPYAIHMASFQSTAVAHEELAKYRRGFQAYLVRADLGKKGIWYRLFLGHFPSATAALDAIKKYRLTGAVVARNRYACLVGAYASAAAADQTARKLVARGFLPYFVVQDGGYYLFTGAFIKKADGRALSKALSAKGFPNTLIER